LKSRELKAYACPIGGTFFDELTLAGIYYGGNGISDVVYSYDSWLRDVIAPEILDLASMNEFAKSTENEVAKCFHNC